MDSKPTNNSKKLIRQVTRHSLGLIRGHVANRRPAKRSRALDEPLTAQAWCGWSGPLSPVSTTGSTTCRSARQEMCLYSAAHRWQVWPPMSPQGIAQRLFDQQRQIGQAP